jgi:hypothetical protein
VSGCCDLRLQAFEGLSSGIIDEISWDVSLQVRDAEARGKAVLKADDEHSEPTEAAYHMFREVNDHLRATELKHLQVSVGFISVTALALSFLVPRTPKTSDWELLFHSWGYVVAYLALVLAGCATMFAQHVYRGWKKDYLLASKKLVFSWPIPNLDRVSWMRTDRGPYAHADRPFFRLAGDNALFWFVCTITTCLIALTEVSLVHLITTRWIVVLAGCVVAVPFLMLFVYVTAGGVGRKRILERNWDDFCERQKRDGVRGP